MAGVKGMVQRQQQNSSKQKIWNSIRSFVRFTQPDLLRTTGAGKSTVKTFVGRLLNHGYIARLNGYKRGVTGSYQGYRLVRDTGHDYPSRCDRCGRPLGESCTKEGIDE